MFRAHDGGHQVAAKSGAGLHDFFVLRVNVQPGTVRGQPRIYPGGNPGRQVAADMGCAVKHDFRPVFLDGVRDYLGIGVRCIVFQQGMVSHIYLIRAVTD